MFEPLGAPRVFSVTVGPVTSRVKAETIWDELAAWPKASTDETWRVPLNEAVWPPLPV